MESHEYSVFGRMDIGFYVPIAHLNRIVKCEH